LNSIGVIGNKIRGPKDEAFLQKHLADFEFIGFLPYDNSLIEADLNGVSPFDVDSPSKKSVEKMITRL
jgi:CO dehydrogenase maturation factor